MAWQIQVLPVVSGIALFALGALSPGPNLLVVARASMAGGYRAGLATGCGVATGDTLYASLGLIGLHAIVARAGAALVVVQVLGGLYLMWLGVKTASGRSGPAVHGPRHPVRFSLARCFRRGLLTDLSNPKTIVFFASIFAVAGRPGTPRSVAAGTLIGIVAFSFGWRALVSFCFSRPVLQRGYARSRVWIDRACGGILALVGLRFATSG